MKNLLVQLTVDQAIKFFEECEKRNANTPELRTQILQEFIENNDCQRAYTTNRSKEEILKDLSREHKVLYVNPPKEENDGH